MGTVDMTDLTDSAVNKQQKLQETQSKAQVLLANLDAAKKQKINNEKLKNLCLDNEELMVKTHNHTSAQKQRRDITRLYSKANELLREFENGISYTHLKKFNVARYMADCGQEMTVKDLVKPDEQPSDIDVQAIAELLRSIKGEGASGEHFTPVIDFGLKLIDKCVTLFQESKLHSGQWARIMDPLLILLKDVMHANPVNDCLVEANEFCARMEFNIEECSQQQADAIAEGEMKEAEALYYQKIQMQEQLSDLIKKKFECLDKEEVTAFKIPIKRVHETHNRAHVEISNVLKSTDKLKKQAQDDLSRLQTEVEKVNLDDYNYTKDFSTEKEKSNQFLKENMAKQEQCWKQIEALENELIRLGTERHEELKERIKSFERDEKRKVEYQHFLEFVQQHKQLLELTIQNCELAEEITDTVDEFISSGCNAIERRMREIEKEVQETRMEIHEKYFSQFREMYLTLGELSYRKEKNVDEVDKKVQLAHIQQEFAMETFNPKAKEYSNQKKELLAAKADMQAQIENLKSRSQQYIEWFEPSEKALIEAGRDFLHPVEELQQINISRSNKLIEYQEMMAQGEDDDAEYASEMAEIERLRALTESQSATIARLTGPPSAGASPTAISPSKRIPFV